MSVHASCPRCGQQVAVANLAPGFAILCAHCGAQFVPIAAGRAAISAFVPVPAVVPIPVVPGERIGWPIRAHDDDDAPTAPQALRFTPWLASVVVHAFAIVSLGILVTPGMASREGVSLLASVAPEELPIDEAPVELDRVVQPALQTNLAAPAAMLAPALPASISTGPVRVAPGTALKAAFTPQDSQSSGTPINNSQPAPITSRHVATPRKPSIAGEGGVSQVATPSDAVDGILGGVRGELESGDLLLVWLLDASLSLVDDRKEVAARIEPFYREFDGRQTNRKESPILMNAVVAYGATTLEMVSPTKFGLKIPTAVEKVPIDPSGLENVMTAIEQSVYQYRRLWRGPMRIVVWTDESGDDILRLEEIIALCVKEKVAVTVVGPTAVFGAEKGSHLYVDIPTGYRFLLPIKRGPDTSLPERIMLPYWFDSDLRPWSVGGAQVAAVNMPWYGGMYREGLLSGVGSYALTRLAMQTGGQYILLDRAGTGGPFKFDTLKQYLPDYGPPGEYVRMLSYHPLRKAVSDAVLMSYREAEALVPPSFRFNSTRDDDYPFSILITYQTPQEFRSGLANTLQREVLHVNKSLLVLEQALALFGAKGMEKHYEREESRRWRAWYDLTRGRMLAQSVRNIEYLYACQLLVNNANFLAPETNHVVFEPSTRLLSNRTDVLARVNEAQRLLKRCMSENPDTPWAALAQWEMDIAPGLGIRQIVVPPPIPGPPAPPRAPVPPLPNF